MEYEAEHAFEYAPFARTHTHTHALARILLKKNQCEIKYYHMCVRALKTQFFRPQLIARVYKYIIIILCCIRSVNITRAICRRQYFTEYDTRAEDATRSEGTLVLFPEGGGKKSSIYYHYILKFLLFPFRIPFSLPPIINYINSIP